MKALSTILIFIISNHLLSKTLEIPQTILNSEELKRLENIISIDNKGNITSAINDFSEPENWFNLNSQNGVEGVGTEKVYEQFSDTMNSQDIIVAVIDSGVDVNHEDLQGRIWINRNEIPNDKIDNDQNGYIDDVFGWNFIGKSNTNSEILIDENKANGYILVNDHLNDQIEFDTLEITRKFIALSQKKLNDSEKKTYHQIEKEIKNKTKQAKKNKSEFIFYRNEFVKNEKILKQAGLKSTDLKSVKNFKTSNNIEEEAQAFLLSLLKQGLNLRKLDTGIKNHDAQIKYHYNIKYDSHSIFKNDPLINTASYGNNNVMGPEYTHGTHVAGIIAANRDNNKGIKGIAHNVKIMAIRCVPNGDERDFNVAHAIRYAVDNGAKVINMSFGKTYSAQKHLVDQAVEYAESKDVILIHAAGNNGQDNDLHSHYPNQKLTHLNRNSTHWLEVGASSYKKDNSLAAYFSNYGKKSVDLFAPGVNILSTIPNNQYDISSGTSMAAPVASGVAALILSYAPQLQAHDVIKLMSNTTKTYPQLYVLRPNKDDKKDKTLFSLLSRTGGIVNAMEAIKKIHE